AWMRGVNIHPSLKGHYSRVVDSETPLSAVTIIAVAEAGKCSGVTLQFERSSPDCALLRGDFTHLHVLGVHDGELVSLSKRQIPSCGFTQAQRSHPTSLSESPASHRH